MPHVLIAIIIIGLLGGGLFLFKNADHEINIGAVPDAPTAAEEGSATQTTSTATSTPTSTEDVLRTAGGADIENQKPLPNPPAVIKAVYATSWTVSSPKQLERLIDLIKTTELNAIVIDIKDFSGLVLYDARVPDVDKYKAKDVRIAKMNSVIKRLHDEGIYVIARQTVFQDPALAKARPDLALKNIAGLPTSTPIADAPVWYDDKKLAWMDPAGKATWDYNIAIAKEAASRGFDEINFDYVRFASDGRLGNIGFPFYDPVTTLKKTVIENFFKYLRENTQGIVISADLFGLTTINNDDLGIGQSLEIAAKYFDYLAPMTYPSHYANGFIGYKNPAEYPYEVLEYSMIKAKDKLMTKQTSYVATSSETGATSTVTEPGKPKYRAKLRPWLQDFDLGADYDAAKVRAQIKAVDDVIEDTPLYNGWMLWDPRNVYTKSALELE